MKTWLFFFIIVIGCSEDDINKAVEPKTNNPLPGCYDNKLYQQHKNDICPMVCIGVKGCDGKEYCNECIVMRMGIRVNEGWLYQ
jgi:hypothetical protein